MQDTDYTGSYLKVADTKPSLLLNGNTPCLIDEWQMAPVLWDAVRFAMDQSGENGQFILTGSAVPSDNVVQHTGTGRFSRMVMRPMSLFESLCIRDLRVYAQSIDADVFHYHDKNGLEADAIVHLKDGRWGAVEVKMGAKEIELAAENLKKLRDKINTEKMKEPSFLMVLTGTEFGYRREDGVYIIPIGCLRD